MSPPPIVVDASIVAAACDGTQFLVQARKVVDDAVGSMFGPSVLWQEFVNGRYRLERRGIHSAAENDSAFHWLDELGIQSVSNDEWPRRALEVARRQRQPRIFDAIYYVCAEDLGAGLWTCDRKFVLSFGDERPSWLKLCPDDV